MFPSRAASFLIVTCLAASSVAAEISELSRDWKAENMRRIGVLRATASSTFGQGADYEPSRAIDGMRHTKWVASDEPDIEHPQWITLELPGTQQVTAVAVFGEAIGNDGVQDAEIQIGDSAQGQFQSVATVRGAQSPSWLARFTPVRTAVVRLLVTRSGGPSTHTDVYEIEVYGTPMPPGELKSFAAERLAAIRGVEQQLRDEAEKLGITVAGMENAANDLAAGRQSLLRLAKQFEQWHSLDDAKRDALVSQLDRLEQRMRGIQRNLPAMAKAWAERARLLNSARQSMQSGAKNQLTWTRDADTLRVMNDQMVVTFHEADGTWDAVWPRNEGACVQHIEMTAEVDGRPLTFSSASAEVASFSDAMGSGLQVRQVWKADVALERCIHLYDSLPVAVASARLTNVSAQDVSIGSVGMMNARQETAAWALSSLVTPPAAVGFPGSSPPCRPSPGDDSTAAETGYGSTGTLAFAHGKSGAMVIAFLSSRQGAPSLNARFRAGTGGAVLNATSSLGNRLLRSGETLDLDSVWLSVEEDRYRALERYADAVARSAPQPVRTAANAVWCSWYPLRMTISEEIVLANAEIASRHFKPLGLNVIQLDHGWQQGDICGDWTPNERFPHGLKWLSDQLRSRFDLQLGLWIAPTQVAVTSDLFKQHPEWMSKGPDGKPATFGRWFWAPNPEMAMLDASRPEAAKWIEETFARLSAEGARYYKIDFIAGSPSLLRAMESIRRGAGADAWIRYCQTPPLLSAGLASSAYIGDDTGDAGLKDWMRLERINSPLLAASYWANDRLYHREVCDMSVGTAADVEEARFRMTLMTMAGCSISFSDDLRTLEPPRIRMMQRCLPPGNPATRPLDLFERELPSLWHLHCARNGREWDAVGVFNFEEDAQERVIEFSSLGLPAATDMVAFEFWEESPLGVCRDRLTLALAPRTARIVLLHRRPLHPEVIATDMHVLGGYHEIARLSWDEQKRTLAGRYDRAAGTKGKAFLFVPANYRPRTDGLEPGAASKLRPLNDKLWLHEVEFSGPNVDWTISFEP